MRLVVWGGNMEYYRSQSTFMRKIYYLLCLIILTGCSKKSVSPTAKPTNVTITYSFSANISGTYSFDYVIPNSTSDTTVQFTGKAWTKSYTVNSASSYPGGHGFPLYMQSTAEMVGELLTLTISINNEIEVTGNSTSVNPNVSVSYNYVITD